MPTSRMTEGFEQKKYFDNLECGVRSAEMSSPHNIIIQYTSD